MSQKIVLLGYSGHSFVVTEEALRSKLEVVGYCDNEEKEINPFGIEYLGKEKDINWQAFDKEVAIFPAIGNNSIRKKLASFISDNRLITTAVVSPLSFISATATIDVGTFVSNNVSINALASIGAYSIINTGSVIEHECTIGSFSHVAPGCILAGNVTVGNDSFIGAKSVIREGVTIGNNVIIGAGSVVVKDIPDNEIWFGNPAKKQKNVQR